MISTAGGYILESVGGTSVNSIDINLINAANTDLPKLTITGIGASAFANLTALTDVIIPTSVTRIGDSAFAGCTMLTEIVIPNSVTSIGDSAFAGCTILTNMVISSGVKSIGANAFSGFTNVIFLCPASAVTNLTGITTAYYDPTQPGWTPSSTVVSLGAAAFGSLFALQKLYLLANGPVAYYPAVGITVPTWTSWDVSGSNYISTSGDLIATMTNISGINYELTSVRLIAGGIFNAATYIDIAAINAMSVTDSTVITTITDGAFDGCTGLVAVNVPFGVTSIGSDAFKNTSIKSIVLPAGLTSIGDTAFYTCSSLTSIVIPASVTSIGIAVFYGCAYLTSIIIPVGVTSLGTTTFIACISLYSIVLPDSLISIGDSAFEGCSSLSNVALPTGLTSLGASAFNGCATLSSIVIPAGVTTLADSIFYNCTNLSSIVLPDSLTSLGASTFESCTSLTTIALPAGLTNIGEAAFRFCGLNTIVVPAGATVGNVAFTDCLAVAIFLCPYANVTGATFGGLSSIFYDDIQYGVGSAWEIASRTNINIAKLSTQNLSLDPAFTSQFIAAGGPTDYYKDVFAIGVPTWVQWTTNDGGITYTCNTGPDQLQLIATITDVSGRFELTSVKDSGNSFSVPTYIDIAAINAVSDPSGSKIVSIGTEAFQNCTGLAAINFTDETVTIGDSAFYGCTGLTSISLSLIQTIGPSAFDGCTGLTTIAIPLVTELAHHTFNGCSALASITAPAVTDFGQYVFSGCSSLVRFTLPAGLIDISDGLFVNCSSLKTVELPSTVTTIGGNAFFECSGLISINIPRSVTTIDPYAFTGCIGLTSISIPSSVTQIATQLCFDCANLSSVLIPASITSVGPFAFAGCPNLSSVVLPTGAVCQGPNVFGTDNPIVVFLGPYSDVSGSDAILTTVYFDPTQTGWPAPSSKYKSLADVSANTLILLKDQYLAAQGPSDYYPAFGIAIPAWGSWPPSNPTTSISTNGLLAHLSVTDDLYTLLDIRDYNGYPFTNSTYIDLLSLANAGGGTIVAIADSAFQGCTGLAAIAIPPSVTDISQNAFYGCTDLVSIVIPSSVPTAYTATFAGCAAATAVFLDPYFITTSVTPYDLLAGLDPSKIYFIPRPVVNPFATPFTDPIPFDPPVVPDWPGTSNSLGGAAPGSLTFMSEEYLVADGPAEYNGVFGLPIPCYVKGTLILTFRDYVPIEDLVEGDMIVSHGSIHAFRCRTGFRFRPIVWKGHFTAHGLDDGSRPICIKKDAFGRNKPFCDLYVSPGHRILVGGRMLTAHELLNGSTVVPHECDEVTYYHIELDRHAVIIANGIAAESYVDVDNRKMFRTSRR